MVREFVKDADAAQRRRNVMAMYAKGILPVMLTPFVFYFAGPLLGRQYNLGTSAMTAAIFTVLGLVLVLWTTKVRTGWGTVMVFEDGLTLKQLDGSEKVIARAGIEKVSILPNNCISISWKAQGEKRPLLCIGREGFTSATWKELLAFVPTWYPDATQLPA